MPHGRKTGPVGKAGAFGPLTSSLRRRGKTKQGSRPACLRTRLGAGLFCFSGGFALAIRRFGKKPRDRRAGGTRHRINEAIWADSIRVVGPEGEDFGILTVAKGIEIAQENQLDLVEVAPAAVPPVCKVMNYGKFKFELEKRERESRKKQKQFSLKEVKVRPKIEDHDRDFKVNHAIEFLGAGHKLKLTVMFSGRELAHPELGHRLLERILKDLEVYGKVETPAKLEGRNLSVTLAPKPGAPKKDPSKAKPLPEDDSDVEDDEHEEDTDDTMVSPEETPAETAGV